MKYEEIIRVGRNLKLKINTNLNTQIYISLKRVRRSIRETDLIINHIFFRVILLAVMFFLNGFKLPSAGKRELNLSESLKFRLFPRAGPAPRHGPALWQHHPGPEPAEPPDTSPLMSAERFPRAEGAVRGSAQAASEGASSVEGELLSLRKYTNERFKPGSGSQVAIAALCLPSAAPRRAAQTTDAAARNLGG